MRIRLLTVVLAAIALAGCLSVTSSTPPPVGSSAAPLATASATLEATSLPTIAPTTAAPRTDNPPGTDTPPGPSEPPGGLQWERIGTVGPPGSIEVEWQQVESIVGFDAGYVAFATTYEGTSRVWFSSEGADWQEVTSFGDEFSVQLGNARPVVATKAQEVLFFADSDIDFQTRAWQSSNGLDWTGNEFLCPTPDDECGPLAVWPAQTGWQAAVYEASQDSACEPLSCERTVFWDSTDGIIWQRRGPIVEGAFGDDKNGMQDRAGGIVVSAEHGLHRSEDGGNTFVRLTDADACTNPEIANIAAGPITASLGGVDQWVIAGPLNVGGAQVCLHDPAASGWSAVALPTSSSMFSVDLDVTRYGLLVNATRDCTDAEVCPQFIEQFLSDDGIDWAPLTDALGAVGGAAGMTVAEGPGGVTGITADLQEGSIIAWRLVYAATQ